MTSLVTVAGALLAAVFIPISVCAARPLNHLSGSTAPYLLAAEHQPVNWYPWGPQAWARARKLKRPVLVDVGAVWCTFCKVMDRESYLKPSVASFINDNFVAVKVDYTAQHTLAKKLEAAAAHANLPVGLPLTVFVTPDSKLYYGGAFFPSKPQDGVGSFKQAMDKALTLYRKHRALIEKTGTPVKTGE